MTGLDVSRSGAHILQGPAGPMEVLFDAPDGPARGIALVGHPQPLLGGNAQHKVPQLLARALRESGWWVARPNFRGVGNSAGSHDEGVGETDDMLTLAASMSACLTGRPLVLVGFSFGAFVQARAGKVLADRGTPAWRTCLAGMPYGDVAGQRRYDTPQNLPDALVVHGERDERVPLASVFDWARPHGQPVTVIPGADHFFTGRLPALRTCVLAHVASGSETR